MIALVKDLKNHPPYPKINKKITEPTKDAEKTKG
jgi:hypothetical protein